MLLQGGIDVSRGQGQGGDGIWCMKGEGVGLDYISSMKSEKYDFN